MVLTLRTLAPLLALLLLLTSSCDKEKEDVSPLPAPAVYNKEVTFRIFTETDYSEARWEGSKMNLTLKLRRISTVLPKEMIVLDTTFGWMPFHELPLRGAPLQLEEQLQEVHKEQDQFVLDVTKVVSINGYETVFRYDQRLSHDKPQETVDVKL
ncbi:hypothetical protein K3G39_04920 [Pontibacter sp. HSC-14F20]|uniref:hypothetical protein n=1 Tax=Pontibacter sp. HSC-14F20 TaxID=2864136 RepID=UPI001C73A04A|nr:hypothetical protein [Pontibacter sp. HSC-14F20]MBX0332574.1 hypothetical protein [Pontibacter sp. HSC-14F20]